VEPKLFFSDPDPIFINMDTVSVTVRGSLKPRTYSSWSSH
jgi:hypothetical protein